MGLRSAAVISVLFLLLCGACDNLQPAATLEQQAGTAIVRHARRFSITRAAGTSTVYLRGDRRSGDTTAIFVIGDTIKPRIGGLVTYIKRPCRKVATLSSIYTQMLYE